MSDFTDSLARQPSIRAAFYSLILTILVFTPFLYHHLLAYRAFCSSSDPAQWCHNFPPSIYTHVQSTYWNVGFLRYWTPQQLPNFLISAPVLALLLCYTIVYVRDALCPRLYHIVLQSPARASAKPPQSPFFAPSLAPHVLHALINTLLLLFAAHTQIILRIAATMPLTYWAAAWLVVEHPRWGSYWIAWSTLWGATSIVLWVTFLPPA